MFESFGDVARDGEVHLLFVVVPVKGDAKVSGAGVFDCDFIMSLEDACQVRFVLFAGVFYAKIVNAQCELDGSRFVEPQAGGELTLKITLGVESFFKKLLC